MSIFNEIHAWAKDQDPLIKEIYLKLVNQNGYSDKDVEKLTILLMTEENIFESNDQSPKYSKFSEQLAKDPAQGKSITLKRIQNIQNVTTIKNETTAPFAHNGITVIYGENGAGKSGIARILKQACRARKVDKVLSNVFQTSELIPNAEIVIQLEDREKTIHWQDGKYTIDELSNISVYDSKCAYVHIDERNQLFFAPKGSEIFQQISACLIAIRGQVEKNKKASFLPTLSKHYNVRSETSELIANIDNITNIPHFIEKTLWTINDEEKCKKQHDLKKSTNEEVNKKEQIKLQQNLKRVTALEEYLTKTNQIFSQEKVKSFFSLCNHLKIKQKALDLLSQELSNQTVLPEVGGDVWRELYLAAKKYSEEVAYPGEKYPYSNNTSAVCVLCQQKYGPEAEKRIISFERLMEDTIKKDFDKALRDLDKATNFIRENCISNQLYIRSIYDDLKVEYDELEHDESIKIKNLAESMIKPNVTNGDGTDISLFYFQSNVLPRIQILKENIIKKLEELTEILKPEKIKEIEINLTELEYKKEIASLQEKYVEYIENSIFNKKIDNCLKRLNTASISRAGNRIISAHISNSFLKRVPEELKDLGAKRIPPINLNMVADVGSVLFEILLENATLPRSAKLSEILSEGEIKVISLAIFFSEINIHDNSYPIVLDDPVTSLDHKYREKIARRLVIEGMKRQIIIFTHDISFVTMLDESCLEEQLPLNLISIRKDIQHSEIIKESPWHAKSVQLRINFLKDLNFELKKEENSINQELYNRRAGEIYGLFRETWERFVEEVLFHKVISRFGYDVKTLSLKGVTITDEDFKIIYWGVSKCSRWMIGHDDSDPLDSNRPSTDDIGRDIKAFEDYYKLCKKRSADLNDSRRSLVEKVPKSPVG